MEQPQSTNPVDGDIIVSASSSIWQHELHLNDTTAQPRSKNPVNATTDNNDIIVDASTSISNEELIVAQATPQPCSTTPTIRQQLTMHLAAFGKMNCF
jgi:hypothetical protein